MFGSADLDLLRRRVLGLISSAFVAPASVRHSRTGAELRRRGSPLTSGDVDETVAQLGTAGMDRRVLRLRGGKAMDPYDVRDVHPDIRAAMRLAGIEIAAPERWPDEQQPLS